MSEWAQVEGGSQAGVKGNCRAPGELEEGKQVDVRGNH